MHRAGVTAVLLAALAFAALTGCARAGDDDELRVVTTVAPLTSIVAAVAGDHAKVIGIVPEGTNSHTFEPTPSDAQVLSSADLVIVNGVRLEEPTLELARKVAPQDTTFVDLGAAALAPGEEIYDFSFPREDGKPNPHLWTDPTYAVKYAATVRDALTKVDPANGEEYARGFERFATGARALDAAIRTATATVPPAQRRLLTYHDAYAYFARSYGWQVVGAVQPKDFEDPTPREVARIVDQVRAEKVPTIFGSEVFPSPVLERIGRETGARYEDTLRDDDLPGKPGAPEHSWLGLMRYDYITMVRGLGGDPAALEAVPLPTTPDSATYPQ
jgi:ABC-type Zn uptake system ZnuABC Zn-binding protein ZnuA